MDKEKMFPKNILAEMPELGATAEIPSEEVKVHIKIFNPYGEGTWYLTEYCPQRKVFYGLCVLQVPELGTVSKTELEELRISFFGEQFTLDRDLWLAEDFTLSQAMEREEALRAG